MIEPSIARAAENSPEVELATASMSRTGAEGTSAALAQPKAKAKQRTVRQRVLFGVMRRVGLVQRVLPADFVFQFSSFVTAPDSPASSPRQNMALRVSEDFRGVYCSRK